MNDDDDNHARVLCLLERHGWNATSFQVLEQGFSYCFIGDDACVAYADTRSAWVVAGAPIADASRLGEVAKAFERIAAQQRRHVVYFGVEQRFLRQYEGASLQVGEQAVWSARAWERTVQSTRSLKEQLRRARAKQVTIRELSADEIAKAEVRAEIARLIRAWFASRAMPPMGFLVDVQPFGSPERRRYFAAEREGALVGFLAAVPVYGRKGWLLEDLLRAPGAPNGTSELLVDAAMRAFVVAGEDYVTMGLAPLSGAVGPWLRLARKLSFGLYDFDGVRRFKAKLRPETYEPLFLARPKSVSAVQAIVETLRAFARGSLTRFAWQAISRGPAIVLVTLAALLVPWTALLALSSDAWFPSRAVKWAWVAFDVFACGALFALARRYRRGLGTLMAALVTADAFLTLTQAIFYNAPRAGPVWSWVVITLACAAPALASVILWQARAEAMHRSGARGISS